MIGSRFTSQKPKPQRRFYTIHLQERNRPFVFQINHTPETVKSTLVYMRSLNMTKDFVTCIRSYYAYHQSWPNTELGTNQPLVITAPNDIENLDPIQWQTVPKLWIVSWTEDELDTYAKNHLLDLIEINDDGKTTLYTFQYELTELKSYFTKKYK